MFEELKAKNKKTSFIGPLIVALIPFVGVTYAILKNPKEELKAFSKNPIGLGIFIALMLSGILFFSWHYFDKRIKLNINHEGITIKKVTFKWADVWYYFIKETKGKYTSQFLIVKLHDDEKEIKLDITNLNKSEEEILSVLIYYSSKSNALFLGKDVITIS